MKKPAIRCLSNPTNFVGTGRLTKSKYERVECDECDGKGKRKLTDFVSKVGFSGVCICCKGRGYIWKTEVAK